MEVEVLVAGLKIRNKDSIGTFWNIYYEKIFPICAFILGPGPDARDLTVDILVDFIEKRVDSLSSSKAVYAFLRQTAVRRAIRFRDKRNRMTPFETDNHVSEDITPDEAADINMLMPFLHQCLDKLTPKAQTTLRLKYSQKISNERIGEIVGGSKSYIGRLLKQGKSALKRCIENKLKQTAMDVRPGKRWSDVPKPVVELSTVDSLLARRACHEPDECDDAVRVAEALVDSSDELQRAWLSDHLANCPLCRETLLQLETMAALPDKTSSSDTERRESSCDPSIEGSSRWKTLSIAAAILLLLSVVHIVVQMQTDKPAPGEGLSVKGGDGFFVAVQRGNTRFTLRPLDRLEQGDKLGFFYSTQQPGYLSVFSMDVTGTTNLLYPAGGKRSAAISVNSRTPLNDGAVVGEGSGCEWLLAVFSSKPLENENIAREIRTAKRSQEADGCQLSVTVKGARAVRVLPVKR